MKNKTIKAVANSLCDSWLLFATISLVLIGFVMVASASIGVSEHQYHQPFYFFFKQMSYLVLGIILASLIGRIELQAWQHAAKFLIIITYLLLLLVLIPGIGKEVNGSMRWIHLGFINVQVSELAKLFCVIYLADYLSRREQEVQTKVIGFLKPMFLLSIMAILLLLEPDFGTTGVMMATALGMMFLAGVPFWQFLTLIGVVCAALASLAISSPYRLERLTGFLNPWSDQFDSGYQLTQSLIAFGRGGWLGVGLGGSVQKLFYLPEAHTDFVFAVLGEELGLLGVLSIISLFMLLVGRSFWIGKKAQQQNNNFAAYLAYGLALWVGLQALINIGVNSGVLPTKGLTLPFMSYGGSSMVVMCIVIALLLRVDFEVRRAFRGHNSTVRGVVPQRRLERLRQ